MNVPLKIQKVHVETSRLYRTPFRGGVSNIAQTYMPRAVKLDGGTDISKGRGRMPTSRERAVR